MVKLIKLGLAYADDTEAEEMKRQRDEGIESKYRSGATIEENLKRFELMLKGLKEEKNQEEEKKGGKGKKDQKKGKDEAKEE